MGDATAMERRTHIGTPRRVAAAALLVAGASLLTGCFDAPRLEDRWTRIDLAETNVAAFQTLTLGAPESIHVQADITYRSILTGFAIADLRVSPSLPASSLHLEPTAPRDVMAADVDTLLAHSYSVGRATRAVTGWDHLIQRVEFTFNGHVPAVLDSTSATGGGLFLVCYLGAGERVRRLGMDDTLVVTPFTSSTYKILPVGITFRTAPAVAR
jgi:hypothetical protein